MKNKKYIIINNFAKAIDQNNSYLESIKSNTKWTNELLKRNIDNNNNALKLLKPEQEAIIADGYNNIRETIKLQQDLLEEQDSKNKILLEIKDNLICGFQERNNKLRNENDDLIAKLKMITLEKK